MPTRQNLPLLPLDDVVVLPGMAVPPEGAGLGPAGLEDHRVGSRGAGGALQVPEQEPSQPPASPVRYDVHPLDLGRAPRGDTQRFEVPAPTTHRHRPGLVVPHEECPVRRAELRVVDRCGVRATVELLVVRLDLCRERHDVRVVVPHLLDHEAGHVTGHRVRVDEQRRR
jgi:hypothetical protein